MVCKYSVVIPVYNTTEALVGLVEEISRAFLSINEEKFEIIFVNDASPNPETNNYLKKCLELSPRVKVITFTKNFGQQPATICGIENSRGDYVITMDDDMQHHPRDIPLLIYEKQHDVVIARLKERKHGLFRILGSKIKNYFDYLILGKPRKIKLSSFRLINRTVADNIGVVKTPNPFIPAILFLITDDVVNVDVEHHERVEGKSGYNVTKMIRLFSNLMINNSSFLLAMLGRIGIMTASGSIVYGIYLMVKKLVVGVNIEGWASLMVALLFIGGLLLFGVGIIGEYLIRVIQSAEQKPSFIIRKIQKGNE